MTFKVSTKSYSIPLELCDITSVCGNKLYHFIGKRRPIGYGWLVVLRIYVASAVFQPYRDLEAGDNQSLKIQVGRPGIEPRSSCSASQELNHSATAAPP